MAQPYIRTPFAINGDVGSIPEATQPDGSVSFNQGFGVDYQLDPDSDPAALNVPRLQFNELMFIVSKAIQVLQQQGFPDFITSSDNDGAPYPYATNATVRFGGVNYTSLIDGNTDTPPSANWNQVSYANPIPTATGMDFHDSVLPSGYVWANFTTIGSAASNATQRANADTQNLFAALWRTFPNSTLPIFNSNGTFGTRGISAAADFAANKQLPVPDKRCMASIGAGNIGGTTDRGLITVAGCGISGVTMGANGGTETVALTANQNGTHTHTPTLTDPGHRHGFASGDPNAGSGATESPPIFGINGITEYAATGINISIANSGLGSPHQNVQPSLVCNYIIKL